MVERLRLIRIHCTIKGITLCPTNCSSKSRVLTLFTNNSNPPWAPQNLHQFSEFSYCVVNSLVDPHRIPSVTPSFRQVGLLIDVDLRRSLN